MQRPTDTGPALAGRTFAVGWRAAFFLALRGRGRRIARGLRRLAQRRDLGFQHRDPLLRRRKLGHQRQDQRVLVGMAQLAEVGRWGHPAFRIESPVIASRTIRRVDPTPAPYLRPPHRQSRDGEIRPPGEQLPTDRAPRNPGRPRHRRYPAVTSSACFTRSKQAPISLVEKRLDCIEAGLDGCCVDHTAKLEVT